MEGTVKIACSLEQELLELVMLRRKDRHRRKHTEPFGVIFKYEGWENDKDSMPIIPQKLHFTIRVFNQEIEGPFTELKKANATLAVRFLNSSLTFYRNLTLGDEQDNLLLYFLRDLRIAWGELFPKMEEIGNEYSEIIENLLGLLREMDAPRKMEPRMAGIVTQREAEKKALHRAMEKKKK